MNKRFLRDSKLGLSKHLVSFRTASERKDDDVTGASDDAPMYAFDIEPECNKDCVDFDAVQKEIASSCRIAPPCSVDALTSNGSLFFAIEFKTGGIELVNIHRKIYDTILTFIAHDGKSLAFARERFVYVLVLSRLSKEIKQMAHYLLGMKRPWEKIRHQKDILSLFPLKNYLVNDVIAMPPEFFRLFLHENKLL